MARGERLALSALVGLALVTVAWWALALWPAGDAPPGWLERVRGVCFNVGSDGLPDASGWLLLVGQPIGMLAVLIAVGGDQLRGATTRLLATGAGRAALAGCGALLLVGVAAAGLRVADVSATGRTNAVSALPPDTYPRLDRRAPALSLLDQNGERITLDDLAGRPALVTFAFGNCETVCPAVVGQTLAVQERLRRRDPRGAAAALVPRILIVSLDPWRDTPGRLGHLADHWKLGPDAHVLSGSVEEVESVLHAWNVARKRDPKTGDVTHPALVYIVDGEGKIAYATRGDPAVLVELLGRV